MDIIRPDEIEAIRSEAAGENRPVLMMNCNRYVSSQFPDGELYVRWRAVNQQMLDAVDGKILWTKFSPTGTRHTKRSWTWLPQTSKTRT